MPGTARTGAIEASGLDGPITIARARAIASSTAAVGRACSAPRNSSPSTGPAARSRIMNSWKLRQPAGPRDPRAHGLVAHRQHARAHAEARGQLCEGVGRRASGGKHPRALDAPGEIAVPEVEPHVRPERPQRVHHREAVLAQPPAALVDRVGQPEGHEIGVGRDVRAVDLDVIAAVGDHAQALRGDHIGHPARELRPAGAASEHDDATIAPAVLAATATALRGRRGVLGAGRLGVAQSHGGSDMPLRRIPAWTL